ncbi:MAG: histidinol-phosphate transaminase [Lachnospiraceae bacterium]|nr:histidinol-phosphate transaminase [Lachnospiraceae bacterium]
MNWESNVRKVVPYVPGEQPSASARLIKLNTNENPYPPAPGVEEILKEYDISLLRKYPDATCSPLVNVLAEKYNVKPSQVFVGVGSDDVLAMAFLTFFNSEKSILFPDITYSFYDVWAELFKIPYKQIPLDEEFRIRPEDYKAENGGVVIANPNAPTGVFMGLDGIRQILDANRDVVCIVDEAYVDFGAESTLSLLDEYDNLLVIQTFSKSRSMAGLRIGFAIGSETMIKYLNDVKYSYNSYTMTSLTLALGVEAVKDDEYFRNTCEKIVKTREKLKEDLKELGFEFQDSKTNFIFAKHESVPAEHIFTELRKRNIYVRYWNKPRISDYLRITVGTDEECDILVRNLKEIVK